jgi:hypothetical protein
LTVLLSGLSQHRGDVAILDDGNFAQRATLFSRRQYLTMAKHLRPIVSAAISVLPDPANGSWDTRTHP